MWNVILFGFNKKIMINENFNTLKEICNVLTFLTPDMIYNMRKRNKNKWSKNDWRKYISIMKV